MPILFCFNFVYMIIEIISFGDKPSLFEQVDLSWKLWKKIERNIGPFDSFNENYSGLSSVYSGNTKGKQANLL